MNAKTVIVVLVAACIVITGAFVADQSRKKSDYPSSAPTTEVEAKTRSSQPSPDGYIEGPVSFPGEAIPDDLRVCAINLATSHETCTRKIIHHDRFKNGRGYRLAIVPGNYQVYAVVPSFDPGYQAFYSAFVVCGYRAECVDHSPITIHVEGKKTRTGIEPGDFYD